MTATLDSEFVYNGADFVIVATPTNYDSNKNDFDTSAVEAVIKDIVSINLSTTIVIKSTVPVGYTRKLREEIKFKNLIFSPEFLRESKALYYNLYPSRIIVGTDLKDEVLSTKARCFADIWADSALAQDIEKLVMGDIEA